MENARLTSSTWTPRNSWSGSTGSRGSKTWCRDCRTRSAIPDEHQGISSSSCRRSGTQEDFVRKYYQAATPGNVARIERLITELINLSRPKPPRLRKQPLNTIIESVVVLHEARVPEKGLNSRRIARPPPFPGTIRP